MIRVPGQARPAARGAPYGDETPTAGSRQNCSPRRPRSPPSWPRICPRPAPAARRRPRTSRRCSSRPRQRISRGAQPRPVSSPLLIHTEAALSRHPAAKVGNSPAAPSIARQKIWQSPAGLPCPPRAKPARRTCETRRHTATRWKATAPARRPASRDGAGGHFPSQPSRRFCQPDRNFCQPSRKFCQPTCSTQETTAVSPTPVTQRCPPGRHSATPDAGTAHSGRRIARGANRRAGRRSGRKQPFSGRWGGAPTVLDAKTGCTRARAEKILRLFAPFPLVCTIFALSFT